MKLLIAIKRFFRKLSGGGNDRTLRCVECGQDFVFEEGEQEFFKQKGLSEPKRCPECRRRGRPSRGGGRSRRRG